MIRIVHNQQRKAGAAGGEPARGAAVRRLTPVDPRQACNEAHRGRSLRLTTSLLTGRGFGPGLFPIQFARALHAQRRRVWTELLPGTRLVATKFLRRCFDCGRTQFLNAVDHLPCRDRGE